VPREIFRLVEASARPSPRMKGYGNDAVGVLQQLAAGREQERRERAGELTPYFVLEGVEDCAQGPFVVPGCARGVNEAGDPPATRALLEGGADDTPREQRVAACAAEGRDE